MPEPVILITTRVPELKMKSYQIWTLVAGLFLIAPASYARSSGGSNSGSTTSANNSPSGVAHVKCVAVQDSDPASITSLLSSSERKKFSASEYALVEYLCNLTDDSTVNSVQVKFDTSFSTSCRQGSSLCLQTQSSNLTNSSTVTVSKDSPTSSRLYALFRNPNARMTSTVYASTLGLKVQGINSNPDVQFDRNSDLSGLSAGINLGGEVKSSTCQVYVTGATGVYTDALCSGDPACTPAGTVIVNNGKLRFQAVLLGAGGTMSLPSSAVKWSGGPNSLGAWNAAPVNKPLIVRAEVNNDGDINYCAIRFSQLGQGYNLHVNKYGDCPYFKATREYYFLDPSNSANQTSGYSSPLKLPGFDAAYGQNAPDVPFRGILNSGEDASGKITINNSQLILPPPTNRKYSSAVVVGLSMDPKTRVVGSPVYWGLMDPSNYQNTILRPVGAEPSDDTLVVFQFFLAHPEIVGGVETRGTTGTPYYTFKEANAGQPYDRLVPVVNESCMPIFQIRTPARSDKAMPAVMKDATTCAFSKPFRAGDVKTGRAAVSVVHYSPETNADTFPLDLVKNDNSAGTSVSSGTATGTAQCWMIYPSFGSYNWTSGSSPPTPPVDECSMSSVSNGTMGYRYNMEAMRWGLGFSNQVKATGVGKIVYRDDNQMSGGGTWGKLILMLFGDGHNLTTNSTVSSGPAAKIRMQNFAVRQWGHPVGNIMTDQSGELGENDNLVTSFSAPICPGAQFQYDNVSLSWSPLILDTEGHGIKVSRVFPRSVGFDITGTDYISYVDWPENTNEVAFLVLPNKKGQVTSIKELFGFQKGFENGFEKLRQYDKNHDGRISKADKIYGRLRLWFDRNRDGKAQPGELVPLVKGGVEMISLNYSRPGRDESAEKKTLAGLYYNSQKKAMMNIEDHYFYEYVDSQRVKNEEKGRSIAGIK